MRAVVWHGKDDVRVEQVADPRIQGPTDAIVRITATALCGSDLHLYANKVPFGMREGAILGHEPVGIVEEVGPDVEHVRPGDRVVVPPNIACGRCASCRRGYHSQCETTRNDAFDKGASIFGYTRFYGDVDGGQAEYLRVPMAHFGPFQVPEGVGDMDATLLADVVPTSWQAVRYADLPDDGVLAVFGLGPIGQMVCRVARHLGAARVIGIDLVDERLEEAKRWGVEPVDLRSVGKVRDAILDMTEGRGADATVDAVGMESAGSVVDRALQAARVKPDRMRALHDAMACTRRGGTLSVVGVYLGVMPLFPVGAMFDKQIQVKWGQVNVRRWLDEFLPVASDPADPLGVRELITHFVPLDQAPDAYRAFQRKDDGAIKIVFRP